jgi:hypothetical protein
VKYLVATGVGEGHVLEPDGDRPAGQLHAGLGRVGHVGRGVDDADDPAPSGDGVLHLVEDLGRLLTGVVNRLTRKRKASSSPRVSEPFTASRVPTTMTTAVVRPDTSWPV